jgi:hypothetical protein
MYLIAVQYVWAQMNRFLARTVFSYPVSFFDGNISLVV